MYIHTWFCKYVDVYVWKEKLSNFCLNEETGLQWSLEEVESG